MRLLHPPRHGNVGCSLKAFSRPRGRAPRLMLPSEAHFRSQQVSSTALASEAIFPMCELNQTRKGCEDI